jgi:pimeloyl-ACP methyl ester carboxylesterase
LKSIYRSDEGRDEIVAWCERRLDGIEIPIERRTIETGLGSSHVTTLGAGPTTVVLLPGTNLNIASWMEMAEALAAEHRVVSIDLPGQPGLSAPERHPHADDVYGVWLAQSLKELGIGSCVLVGHSLGARVALAASVHIPVARAIVALDPAGLVRLRINTAVLLASGRWFRKKDETSSRALLSLMTAPGAHIPDHLVDWMTLVARHTKTTLAPPPLPPMRLKEIDIPIRIVIGESDVFLPRGRVRLGTRKLKTAKVQWVENAGHLMPLEHPEVVARVVKAAGTD